MSDFLILFSIENLNRMKMLQYLNLALNNITKIENLEGCESLKKLDLTVNFIEDLRSIKSLRKNNNLKNLYLAGNPCSKIDMYRQFIVATLPQLIALDGKNITKSERILALQDCKVNNSMNQSQQKHLEKTDSPNSIYVPKKRTSGQTDQEVNNYLDDDDESFWNTPTCYTPESRVRAHERIRAARIKENSRKQKTEMKRELIKPDGKVININEPKLEFTLSDEDNHYVLDLAIFKYLDTSYISVDIQTTFVKATIRGKIFQLSLMEEIQPDKSTAKRSSITGHMVLKMPKLQLSKCGNMKVNCNIQATAIRQSSGERTSTEEDRIAIQSNYLEIKPDYPKLELDKIVQNPKQPLSYNFRMSKTGKERKNSDEFIDNPHVPPLI
ncbi:Protein tilB [Nymphon striatum]|nr:Protein tilB [Nymphon striatum]